MPRVSDKDMTSTPSAPLRLLCSVAVAVLFALPALAQQTTRDETRGAPAEPTDAAETRAQIDAIEKLLPNFPDRAAALYTMAAAQQHLGEAGKQSSS